MQNKSILLKATDILPSRSGMLTGIGRSMIELIDHLQELHPVGFRFNVYCTGLKSLYYKMMGYNISFLSVPLSIGKTSRLSQLCEPILRKWLLRSDLLHITSNMDSIYEGERFVVTIHDMFLYDRDEQSKKCLHDMGNKSLGIATCSEYSKKEIVRILGVPTNKVDVIYWGINHSIFYQRNQEEVARVLNKYTIKTPYFFSCSCGDKRKNPDITLEAFRRFAAKEPNITCVFSWSNCPPELQAEYQEEIVSGRVIIIKGVSNDDLACLYTGALASYFISSAEGFGFPMLESFACGTPCVSCKNTSLEEIGSDLAYFVNERDVEDTVQSMQHFISSGKGDTEKLRQHALKFNWQKTAKSYLEFYKKYA